MNFKQITSRQNEKIKNCVKLINNAKFRVSCGLFVVEGAKIVKDAIKSETEVVRAFVSAEFIKKNPKLAEELSQKALEIFKVPSDIFAKISDTTTSQEIICVCKLPNLTTNLQADGRYILCENLQDPANLGTIIRTANALNFEGIITIAGCDVFSPKAVRATMGAVFTIPLFRFETVSSAMNAIKAVRLESYATVVRGGQDLTKSDFKSGVILIGNEGNGLSEEIVSLADQKISIPMKENADSLNAAAAATIVMWEFAKEQVK